jgi:hypothetical protein
MQEETRVLLLKTGLGGAVVWAYEPTTETISLSSGFPWTFLNKALLSFEPELFDERQTRHFQKLELKRYQWGSDVD